MLANRVRMSKSSYKEYLYNRGVENVPLILTTTFWNSVLEKRSDHIYIKAPKGVGVSSRQVISSAELIDFSKYKGIGMEISGTMNPSATVRFGNSYSPTGVNLSNIYDMNQSHLNIGTVEHRFTSSVNYYFKFYSRTYYTAADTELQIYSIYLITK